MTDIPGIKLAEYLETKGPLPGPQVAKLAIQLAQMMGEESESETGSRAPVLHTGRIIITTSGKIGITPSDETDLGLPIVASFPQHASPEEIRGEEGDFRASLYSLGCTLFEIATGELPYNGDSPKDILKAHLKEDIPDPAEKGADITAELGRTIQELLRKKPEQRIQSVPELLRRLKICLKMETNGAQSASPPPPSKEKKDEGQNTEKEKKSSRPKLKFSSKKKNAGDSSGKTGSRDGGKESDQPPARADRKPPSFSKKKTESSSPKGPGKAGKFKRPEKKKSSGTSRKGKLSGAGAQLSGKLIDRGDDGDIFEDRFEEEANMDYSMTRKKSHPFILAGAGAGVVIAILVVFMTSKNSDQQLEANAGNSLVAGQEKNQKRKNLLKKRYDTERTEVGKYLATQTERFEARESASMIEGHLEQQIEARFYNKPDAVKLGILYAKVHARAEEDRAATKEAETGREGSFESYVKTFNELYANGLWAPAMDKIRDAENEYRQQNEKEIDEMFFKAENAMVKQWETDELKIQDLAGDEPQKAIAVARQAVKYGDGSIRKRAGQYIESINSQLAVQNASGEESEEKEGEPEEDGVPEDLDKELEDLEE